MATDNRLTSRQLGPVGGEPDLNRRILTIVSSFRLLLAAGLVMLTVFQPEPGILGQRYPALFIGLTSVYGAGSVIVALLMRGAGRRPVLLAWLQLILDIGCLVLVAYTSDAGSGGIQALLAIFIVSSGLTLPGKGAYVAAALASLGILLQQVLGVLKGSAPPAEFVSAGVIGAIMFGTVLVIQPLLRRARETEELARQRGIDLRNLAELNDYIIQNLREAILVIDEHGRIRLNNQAAADQLGAGPLGENVYLSDAAPELAKLLSRWRSGGIDLSRELPNFIAGDGSTVISAHFAPLSDNAEAGPVLIFLEDASLLTDKVQQTKLAALGRLSASIAHEIRNPVGALSHAAQLLGESPELGAQDRRFIDIINTNSKRVSEIIDNILQLSRRDATRPQVVTLRPWARDFIAEFVSTHELYEGQVALTAGADVDVRMDPSHLHQVVWNLCENAVKYASETAGGIAVELSIGRLPANGRPFLEISDQGPGIPPDMEDSVFEPFATGRSGGTGLGLYICRELCERNRARLRYRGRDGGGSVFQIVFADPERWEAARDSGTGTDG